jgi:tetratricopeptide (TPR) repeat protein
MQELSELPFPEMIGNPVVSGFGDARTAPVRAYATRIRSITGAFTILLGTVLGSARAEPPAALQAGIGLFETPDHEAAARFFTAVPAGPERAWADYFLGRIAFTAEDWDTAIERLTAAVEAEPESALFHRWAGHAYVEKINTVSVFKKMGLAKQGRKHFEEAVRLAPDDLEARDALVGYHTNAPSVAGGSRKKAEQQVAELTAIDPGKGSALRGRMHFNEREWKEAEAAYRLAVESSPEVAEYHYLLGFARQQQEAYDGAVAAFEQAIAADREFMSAYYQIGRTAALSGMHLERAVECMQRYLESPVRAGQPKHQHAQWRLGMVYEHMGDRERAAAAYRAALALDPEHEEAKKALAKLE